MTNTRLELSSPLWTASPDGLIYYWSSLGPHEIPSQILNGNYDLGRLEGQWALVDLRGASPILAVDRLRSHPLLYTYNKQAATWLISDSATPFTSGAPRYFVNMHQARLFEHFGYSLGAETLFSNVFNVQAGHIACLTENHHTQSVYGAMKKTGNLIEDEAQFTRLFTETMDHSFQRLIDKAQGALFAVPLSGGLDSRLLLTWLKRLGYENVLSFSYGKPQNSEAQISESVAKQLDIPWYFIEYDPISLSQAWGGDAGKDFVDKCWSGTSLPHIQDWYALKYLKERNILPDCTVFLPGHTIVGNMHDEALLSGECNVTSIGRALISHHGNLHGKHRKLRRDRLVADTILTAFIEAGFDGSVQSTQAAIEWFNLRERQAKYINNSMRGYEYFGWRWALPMLDREFWDLWAKGSTSLTGTRDWYSNFVLNTVEAQTGISAPLYAPAQSAIPPRVKNAILSTLQLTGGDFLLRRWRSTKTMRNHPLAFEAFTRPEPAILQIAKMMTGTTAAGLWTEDFLLGRWTTSSVFTTK